MADRDGVVITIEETDDGFDCWIDGDPDTTVYALAEWMWKQAHRWEELDGEEN